MAKLPGVLPEIPSVVVLREQRPCCDIFAGAERVFVEWRVEVDVTSDIRGSGSCWWRVSGSLLLVLVIVVVSYVVW